MNFITT